MDGDPSQARRTALDLVTPLVRSRTVILTGSAMGSRRMARFIADAGARTVSIDLGTVGADTRERFAGYERSLAEPDDTFRAQLDTADPEGRALVYAGSFTTAKAVCGRHIIGARSATHLDVERKDRQRELLGLGGEVVSLADGLAHLALPAVVQGIPDHGVAMATSHTYLVPRLANDNRVAQLTAKLMRDCTYAVASGFNSGVPCTFYGFITDTSVVDFGPVEALVYWDPHTWRILAPGILRPLPMTDTLLASARTEVHAVARRLQQRLGYIGAFGTDGILADDHYVIHEINPRICAGFSLLDQLVPEAAPLAGIDLVLRESPDASAALASPLAILSTVLERLTTPAYRLWEAPNSDSPDANKSHQKWAQQVRKMASGGLQPLNELKELAHETNLP